MGEPFSVGAAAKVAEKIYDVLKQDEQLSREESARVIGFDTEYSAWLRRVVTALRGERDTIPPGLLDSYVIWMGGHKKAYDLLIRASRRGPGRRFSQVWALLKRLTHINPHTTSASADSLTAMTQELDLFSADSAAFSSVVNHLDGGYESEKRSPTSLRQWQASLKPGPSYCVFKQPTTFVFRWQSGNSKIHCKFKHFHETPGCWNWQTQRPQNRISLYIRPGRN